MLIHADALEHLKTLESESVDAVVTDPPYGISFMSKGWDTFSGNKAYAQWVEEWASECLRVLKPGGYLLAFSGTRTYHALAWGVESAGFEIRDMIEWLYLSGFPKSMDVGKQFDKQAGAEREVVGTGNVRCEYLERGESCKGHSNGERSQSGLTVHTPQTAPSTELAKQWDGWGTALKPAHEPIVMARKPFVGTVCANIETHGTGAINVDACRIGDDEMPFQRAGSLGNGINMSGGASQPDYTGTPHVGRYPANCVTTESDAWYSPYFNVTPRGISKKASKKDRGDGNTHPTVKPIALMEWLIRLITPPNGIVLDPFAGSGTTLVAAKRGGFDFIGIEREAQYVDIARKRLGDI